MAAPSVTNTFVANTTASASEVNANFSDIIDGLSSGTDWDVYASTLTATTISVDTIDEKTSGDGVLITGRTDGTNPTDSAFDGKIGEIIETTSSSTLAGSTTLGVYTTVITLSNLPAGIYRFEGIISYASITGTANDTGSIVQGTRMFCRIMKNSTTQIAGTTLAGMGKSTVNSGYLITSGVLLGYDSTSSSTDDYTLEFTTTGNSGSPTITACNVSGVNFPITLRAIRIA